MSEARFVCSLGEDALLFRRLHGREELGRPSTFLLELLRESAKEPLKAQELLGKPACIAIETTQSKDRFLHGVVTEFERGGDVAGRYDVYRLVMRPWLWQLTLGAECRIFQDKSVRDIIKEVFREYGAADDIEEKLSGTYSPRPYTVQYRESDFSFVSRLMEEEGIYYYFRHESERHVLVLCDGPSGHSAMPGGTVHWASKAADRYREDVITHWNYTHSLQSLKYTTTDFAAEAPTTDLTATASRTAPPYPKPSKGLEVYDYPGGHDDLAMGTNTSGKQGAGKRLAEIEVARYESRHSVVTAMTLHRPLAVGSTFHFADHADAGDYLVTSSITVMEFAGYEGISDETKPSYHCRFDAVPKSVKFQPLPQSQRPIVHGPQTATVVGPSGAELHTDKFGRVKVQFHWDRLGKKDDKSSCWVRVSQPWAGKGFGAMALPRVGDEVVVDFLEGDPDRPLVTGRVYNGDNMPPWELPAQATVNGVKSRSSKGGAADNANELRFDDKKGSEYVWFQAEKDYHHWVKNDAQVSVLGNRAQEIKKDEAVKIGGKLDGEVVKTVTLKVGEDTHATIGGDLSLKVTGATGLSISGATAIKSVGNTTLTTDDALELDAAKGMKLSTMSNVHIKAMTGVVIDGGVQLAIKAGAGFITLGPDGVSIVGPIVKINSGGSAGSASAAAKANPARPKQPPAPKEHKDPLPK